MNAIRQKIFGGKENTAITLGTQIENAKNMLLNETNFDLDNFLTLTMRHPKKIPKIFHQIIELLICV